MVGETHLSQEHARREDETRRFQAQYQPFGPALQAWARLRIPTALRSRLDPEDLAQEVCCRAFARFDVFDPERGSFRAWLFGIANVVLKDLGRKLARLPDSGRPLSMQGDGSRESAGLDALPVEITSISTRAARDELLERFMQHVDELPEDERSLLLYRGIEGLDWDDTAALLGVGVEAARKRWQRLLTRLRSGPLPVELVPD